MNTAKTVFLLTLLTLLLISIGGLVGGRSGVITAFTFALILNGVSYWFSDKIVLAMYGAKGVTEREAPQLYRITRNLIQRANLPMPRLYIIPTPTPNAFATGRNPSNAAVAVTSGILELLSEEELEGVISHELAHIKNRDILIGSVVATIAGAISMLAHMAQWVAFSGGGRRDSRDGAGAAIASLIMVVLAPVAAMLIQMAISRSREYQADETGAISSGRPMELARALLKLEKGARLIPMDANPATAHMFIVNPLRGESLLYLFSTHPPIEKRVKNLERLAGRIGLAL